MSTDLDALLETMDKLRQQVSLLSLKSDQDQHYHERIEKLQEQVKSQAENLATAHVLCNMLDIPMEHISVRLPKAIEIIHEIKEMLKKTGSHYSGFFDYINESKGV